MNAHFRKLENLLLRSVCYSSIYTFYALFTSLQLFTKQQKLNRGDDDGTKGCLKFCETNSKINSIQVTNI